MSGARPRVRALAVDDEPAILATFRRAFHRDFELITESDPVRGLEQLRAQTFDVIFVDYAMPGMNGVMFLERARALQPGARAYLVTAHAPSPETDDAIARGLVTEVIAKPWSRADVLARLAWVGAAD